MTAFEESVVSLSPIQATAVDWQDGPALVLAGPGAGKTRVLTTRMARILNATLDKRFRILALTFTTKAAGEMRERLELMAPGVVEERTFIGTFHAFCTQILRQHGSLIGISPDFGIFGQKEDQEAFLEDALRDAIGRGEAFTMDDINKLSEIKQYKARLTTPEKVLKKTGNIHLRHVYELYDRCLKDENALDFEGLILETCRLLSEFPAVSGRIRKSYPFWLVDEFQDTSPAQYWLLHYLAGGNFRNIFAVADDDQIIYQFAGASYRQLEKYRNDYSPTLIQLTENHRCPPEVVIMANQLVAHNVHRAPDKIEIVASRQSPINAVSFHTFETDEDERQFVSDALKVLPPEMWGKTVILARNRFALESMLHRLKENGITAALSQRRDSFISPQFVWLDACLDQVIRPGNKRIFSILVNSANRICGMNEDADLLRARSESEGHSPYEIWAKVAVDYGSGLSVKLGGDALALANARGAWKGIVDNLIPILLEDAKVAEGAISDADEDYSAWTQITKEIRGELGGRYELADFVQGMALRSKEPPRESETVALMTVHASKGLEFDKVFVIGLAEGELPSWQACEKGDSSQEMEEERRNCFVAITRTQENLILSRANSYRGRNRNPSRFLAEMGFFL